MGKELYNTYPVAKAVFIEGSDILPDSYAGHSVGEYAAPACSGAMRFEDGLSLILVTTFARFKPLRLKRFPPKNLHPKRYRNSGPRFSRNGSVPGSDGRCVQRAGT